MAKEKASTVNYFFYKCGNSNCWLPLAIEGHGLYVGFSDSLSPTEKAPKKEDRHPIAARKPEEQYQRLTGLDDDHIAWLSHQNNRQRFLLITFSQSDLIFWEVLGKVKVHRPGEQVFERAREMWRNDPEIRRHEYYNSVFQNGAVSAIFKTLPSRKLAAVPRRELYASIDSLAVYQYLNRGTCRAIWRINGPTEGVMPEEIVQHRQEVIPHGSEAGEETKFATFVRLYLNAVLQRKLLGDGSPIPPGVNGETTLACVFAGLLPEARRMLVLSTLNPILVETAALYFCLDLGLVADIGTGKGIDVIDVRARAESKQAANQAVKWLRDLTSEGIQVNESVSETLRTDRVLELQCKAAHDRVSRGDLLYFGYRRKDKGISEVNTISLPDLLCAFDRQPWRSGLLQRFVSLQENVLSQSVY